MPIRAVDPSFSLPVEFWLLATIERILQLSHVIGRSGSSEQALLLQTALTYQRYTLLHQHWDQSLGVALALT